MDRKALLVGTQVLALAVYLLLGILVLTDALRLWHFYTMFALLGVAAVISQPARQALVAQVVPKEELTNALSLQQLAFNGAYLGAPMVAGLLMAAWGPGPVFGLLALGSVVVVVTTVLLHPPSSVLPGSRPLPFAAAVQGLTYVARAPLLRLLVLLTFLAMLLGFHYSTLLPKFAQEVFGIGAGGFGVMTSASGAGAFLGTFLLASVSLRRPAAVAVAAIALFRLYPGPLGLYPLACVGHDGAWAIRAVEQHLRDS
jgi:MFS family permease